MGRVFGVIELYFLSAALALAAIAGLLAVALRRPRVAVRRWVRPEVLTAGDVGRVDVVVRAHGIGWRPSFELIESVGTDRTARMSVTVDARRHREERRLPRADGATRRADDRAAARGAFRRPRAGPLDQWRRRASTRSSSRRRAFELNMPELGDGILGRHLLAQSVRLGPGEFHSLREYVPGDEPRTIHWRGIGAFRRPEGPPALRRRSASLHGRARPAGRHRRSARRGVRARRRRRGEPRAQLRPGHAGDPLRHDRRRRPARTRGLGPHDAPPRTGDA